MSEQDGNSQGKQYETSKRSAEYDTAAIRRQKARNAGRQFRSKLNQADEELSEKEPLLSPTVKGIIGILVSLTFVAVIIMLFSKVLFLHEPNQDIKTGTITVTSPTGTTAVTTTGLNKRQSRETKKTTRYNDNGKNTGDEGDGNTPVTKIKCISPVLVHPKPNSSSENLTTVPLNAQVDFIRDENGWYYITYNGITGYAWGQFFEAPKTQ